jgi:predicted nuclease of predicted toxin-antitoxin system
MKLLFDENLSPKLPRSLATLFPGGVHARECGLLGRSDGEVWAYARDHDFILVSKDSDFQQRSLLYGHPPKLVWLRIGNCTRQELVRLLTLRQPDVAALAASSTESVLVIS